MTDPESWTEEEKEQAWYCAYCSKSMRDSDPGVVLNNDCFCSDSCSVEFFA